MFTVHTCISNFVILRAVLIDTLLLCLLLLCFVVYIAHTALTLKRVIIVISGSMLCVPQRKGSSWPASLRLLFSHMYQFSQFNSLQQEQMGVGCCGQKDKDNMSWSLLDC